MSGSLRLPGGVYEACQYFMPRMMFLHTARGPQLQWGDIVQALHDVPTGCTDLASGAFWDEWMIRWERHGIACVEQAKRVHPGPGRARCYRTAAASFHWAEFMYFSDRERKTRLRERVRDCFLESLKDSDLDVSMGVVRWQGVEIPYYLLLPTGNRWYGPRPPCVILSNGLDSVTELEPFAFAEQFLERGMAALLFEGPGQGRQVGCTPLDPRVELIVPELVRALRAGNAVDCERLGFFGVSFGGYLALRVAQHAGHLFRGVVNLSGGPCLAPYATLPRRLKEDFEYAFMPDDVEAMQARFDALRLDLSRRCETDVLSIHGALDDIFPVSGIELLEQAWAGRHRAVIYPRAAHVCLNHIGQYSVDLTDWLAERLLPDAPVRDQQAPRDEEPFCSAVLN